MEMFDDVVALDAVQYATHDFFHHPPSFRYNTTWDIRGPVSVEMGPCPPVAQIPSRAGPHGTFK